MVVVWSAGEGVLVKRDGEASYTARGMRAACDLLWYFMYYSIIR